MQCRVCSRDVEVSAITSDTVAQAVFYEHMCPGCLGRVAYIASRGRAEATGHTRRRNGVNHGVEIQPAGISDEYQWPELP